MRGKEAKLSQQAQRFRITPAYAGKRYSLCTVSATILGSPPRMRGKATAQRTTKRNEGITPAYAGKRIPPTANEHSPPGSPPRMRGKVYARLPFARKSRITPAYAGKRKNRRFLLPKSEDHPRVCGEKLISKSGIYNEPGSPPRMRGKVTQGRLRM